MDKGRRSAVAGWRAGVSATIFVLLGGCQDRKESAKSAVARDWGPSMTALLQLEGGEGRRGGCRNSIVVNGRVEMFDAPVEDGVVTATLPKAMEGKVSNAYVRFESGETCDFLFHVAQNVYVTDSGGPRVDLVWAWDTNVAETCIAHLVILDSGRDGGIRARAIRSFLHLTGSSTARVPVSVRDLLSNHEGEVVLVVFKKGDKLPFGLVRLGAASQVLDSAGQTQRVRVLARPTKLPEIPKEATSARVQAIRPLGAVIAEWKDVKDVPRELITAVDLSSLRLLVEYEDHIDYLQAREHEGTNEDWEIESTVRLEEGDSHVEFLASERLLPSATLVVDVPRKYAVQYGKTPLARQAKLEGGGFKLRRVPREQCLFTVRGPGNFTVLGAGGIGAVAQRRLDCRKYGQMVFDDLTLDGSSATGLGFQRAEFYLANKEGALLYQGPINVWPWRSPYIPMDTYQVALVFGQQFVFSSRVIVGEEKVRVAVNAQSAYRFAGEVRRPGMSKWGRVRMGAGSTSPWAWAPVAPDGSFDLAGGSESAVEPVVFEFVGESSGDVFMVDAEKRNVIE